MEPQAEKIILSHCRSCDRETKHKICKIKKFESDGLEEYMYGEFYMIIECCGCEGMSFRKELHEYMHVYHDLDGNEVYDISIETYPKALRFHKKLNDLKHVPPTIAKVYYETIKAFECGSNLLAGVGFRAIIEAVCQTEKIKGNDLEKKIDNLLKNNFITIKESERLHSIRFLGNDSVHQMDVPADDTLYLVLNIVEHLLKNLYILDYEVKSKLTTIIKEYNELNDLIRDLSKKFKIGDLVTLKQILGKDVRRIPKAQLATLENSLIARIKSNSHDYLQVDSTKLEGNITSQVYKFVKIDDSLF